MRRYNTFTILVAKTANTKNGSVNQTKKQWKSMKNMINKILLSREKMRSKKQNTKPPNNVNSL